MTTDSIVLEIVSAIDISALTNLADAGRRKALLLHDFPECLLNRLARPLRPPIDAPQYAQSQEYYAKARRLADQYDHPFEKTEPARHAAFHALREGEIELALDRAREALALREAAGFRPYLPLDHLLLRDIYQSTGDTAQAQWHAQQAQALAGEMGLETLVASVPNILGVLATQ